MTLSLFPEAPGVFKTATLSPCGAYRYSLSRVWRQRSDPWNMNLLVFVMLNPSTADADVDDPTIRRCVGFGEREGADGIHVLNLFALRATNPRELAGHPDPVGPDNGRAFQQLASRHPHWRVIVAWGADKAVTDVALRRFVPLLMNHTVAAPNRGLYCLGKNGDGSPKHPLYLPASAPLMPWLWKASP